MQFKYPEVLWTLLILVIPFLIHLFNLRRYRTVKFTNVAFLKAVTQQNRKRSQLKKWIILLLRLLALACLIIAFAQPQSEKGVTQNEVEMVIYVDNSFSMQAYSKGTKLLESAINDLLVYLPNKITFSLFTNSNTFKKVTKDQVSNQLLNIPYSSLTLNSEAILAQGMSLFNFNKKSYKYLLLISDFKGYKALPKIDDRVHVGAISLKSENNSNTAITDVALISENQTARKLEVSLQSELKNTTLPVAVYNDSILTAKVQATFSNHKAIFNIPIGDKSFPKGKVYIKDGSMGYDNTFYFTVADKEAIRVMAINASDDRFLRKIFNTKEFVFTSKFLNTVNYSDIAAQNLLILNGLSNISPELQIIIDDFLKQGGHLVIIPSDNANIDSYNILLKGKAKFEKKINTPLKINNISFSHPLYKEIFSNRINNFKYPEVKAFFPINSTQLTPVLIFENQKPFLASNDVIHLFAYSLGSDYSSFQNSSLVALSFYNMAKHSFKYPPMYYTVGKENQFDVPTRLEKGESLRLITGEYSFTPIQLQLADKVRISTTKKPRMASNFEVINNRKTLLPLSYNFDRQESFGKSLSLEGSRVTLFDDLSKAFNIIKDIEKGDELWRWFLMFTLIFILLEMIVLKFIK